ncbi:MAG: DUF5107 domain-containing protein [Christensenellales bacterium]|jgi:tetratricopeptide (TPR) repeat protein
MSKTNAPVTALVETMIIPTYPPPLPEEVPIYAEFRNHQGTTGNPYPNRPVTHVDQKTCRDEPYEVIRMENDYIRLIIIPALGGRIFEAYDKTTGYDFLYRQHVIKPALIGAYGSWISGGMEFNWPFHHRPSTFMPVDYFIEYQPDGTAITWLSEHDPVDRTKGMVGIVLHPDRAFFETRMKVTNRTPLAHSFLWWENAAVSVDENYQIIFPPDVSYVVHHHHQRRTRLTYPVAQGEYAGAYYEQPTDISWFKNSPTATSYFAAASKYDFFGGYDHGKNCGIIHIADHHTSPGKKMFTWGLSAIARSWESALTDNDGPYIELMASSYSDNQPDFTWIEPYETKSFSQFWYPVSKIGAATFATLDAAICVDMEKGRLSLQTTGFFPDASIKLICGENTLLSRRMDFEPGKVYSFDFEAQEKNIAAILCAQNGEALLEYEKQPADTLHMPEKIEAIPVPSQMKTPQELYLAGLHFDQYRDPTIRPDVYYEKALERDPQFIPALIAMGEYCYRRAFYDRAVKYLERAVDAQCQYNKNPPDGTAGYLLGKTLIAQEEYGRAYDVLSKAAWSGPTVAKAMTAIAALDGRKGDYRSMLRHSSEAVSRAVEHPVAIIYASLASFKLGDAEGGRARLENLLQRDPLNHLARCAALIVDNQPMEALLPLMRSDPSQTCLDIAFDLMAAGFFAEAAQLLEAISSPTTALVHYTLATLYDRLGDPEAKAIQMEEGRIKTECGAFPHRLEEIAVLRRCLDLRPDDANAANLLACALYGKGHHARAAQLWQTAAQLKPDQYMYKRNLAMTYYSYLGRRQDAMQLLKEAAFLNPDSQQVLFELCHVMSSLGVPGKERAQYIQAQIGRRQARDDIALELVKAHNASGDYETALTTLLAHRFIPAEGGEFAIASQYMFSKLALGRRALAKGLYQEALLQFREAQELPPCLGSGFWGVNMLVPARYYEALALSKAGQEREANRLLKSLLSHASHRSADYVYYYALSYRHIGDELQARELMNRSVKAWEAQLKAKDIGWYGTSAAYLSFCNAPSALRKASANYLLGLSKLYEGDSKSAKEFFKKSLAEHPDNLNCQLELELLG